MSTEHRASAPSPDDTGLITRLEEGTWALAALLHLLRTGALTATRVTPASPEECAAADVLVAAGLLRRDAARFTAATAITDAFANGMIGTLEQGMTDGEAFYLCIGRVR